jgi:hypothetical protein
VAEASEVPGSDRDDVIQVRPRLIRELLQAVPELEGPDSGDGEGSATGPGWSLRVMVEPQETLNKVSQSAERQIYERLFIREHGNFAAMARVLLGNEDDARRVQLRFNQLGLKVRELKSTL